jgi:hypothetical protein
MSRGSQHPRALGMTDEASCREAQSTPPSGRKLRRSIRPLVPQIVSNARGPNTYDPDDPAIDKGSLLILAELDRLFTFFNQHAAFTHTQGIELAHTVQLNGGSPSNDDDKGGWRLHRGLVFGDMKAHLEKLYLAAIEDGDDNASEVIILSRVGDFNEVLTSFYDTHNVPATDYASYRAKAAHWLNCNKVTYKNALITCVLQLRRDRAALENGEIDWTTGAVVSCLDDRVEIEAADDNLFDCAARAHMRRIVLRAFRFWSWPSSTLDKAHTHAHTHTPTHTHTHTHTQRPRH